MVSFVSTATPRVVTDGGWQGRRTEGVPVAHRGPRTLPDVGRGPLECRRICKRGHYLHVKVVIARAGIVYVKWRPSEPTSNEVGARELL